MEAASVRPWLPSGAVADVVEDAAHHLVGAALTAEQLELVHDPVERELDAGKGVLRVAVTLLVQADVTALEFLAIELREQGHTKQRVHGVRVLSERQLPL